MQHHRQGGDADQLEEEYHRLVGKSPSQEPAELYSPTTQTDHPNNVNSSMQHQAAIGAASANSGSVGQRIVRPQQSMNNVASQAVSSSISINNANQQTVLTLEQRAMIEAKREEALLRRQQRMQQQKMAPFNPYAK